MVGADVSEIRRRNRKGPPFMPCPQINGKELFRSNGDETVMGWVNAYISEDYMEMMDISGHPSYQPEK